MQIWKKNSSIVLLITYYTSNWFKLQLISFSADYDSEIAVINFKKCSYDSLLKSIIVLYNVVYWVKHVHQNKKFNSSITDDFASQLNDVRYYFYRISMVEMLKWERYTSATYFCSYVASAVPISNNWIWIYYSSTISWHFFRAKIINRLADKE